MTITKNIYIGIDIGGTKIIIAVISKTGDILFKETIRTVDNLNETILIQNLALIIKKIKTLYPSILEIGIGAAGIILYKKGLIKFSPNIGWKDFELVKKLKEATNLNIFLDNDANAAAWGTFYLKYKNIYKNMICVTLGTGIGGGLIINGEIFRGIDGTAGEIGHMTYLPNGLKCSCGNHGCIERYAGTKGIIEIAENYLKEEKWSNSIIPQFKNEYGQITPKSIDDAAIHDDPLAIHIWKEVGTMLGTVFSSTINLLNLEAIHITGGIAHAQKWIEKDIIESIYNGSFAIPAQRVNLIFEHQKQDMGVIGAGLLTLNENNKNSLNVNTKYVL